MAPPKGWKPTAEQRKRMGDSHRGFKHSPEVCKKYSESKKGEKNPMFGKHHTEETKKRQSLATKGKPKPPEVITRMIIAQSKRDRMKYGHEQTDETKRKISSARKGMRFSPEHKQRLSESHKGQVVSPENRKKSSIYNKTHPEVIERLRKIRCARPSKPQLLLFETIKKLYPDEGVESEWRVDTSLGRRHIDVAIPRLLLGWEYDEPAYHGLYWGSKEKDLERHNAIEALGWKLIHYSNIFEFLKD